MPKNEFLQFLLYFFIKLAAKRTVEILVLKLKLFLILTTLHKFVQPKEQKKTYNEVELKLLQFLSLDKCKLDGRVQRIVLFTECFLTKKIVSSETFCGTGSRFASYKLL